MEVMKIGLDAEKVTSVFMDCLPTNDEIKQLMSARKRGDNSLKENFISVEGIAHSFMFNKERIKNHEREIETFLDALIDLSEPHSFLDLNRTRDGQSWTDFHQDMEQLVALGLATKDLASLFPRELNNFLPGGVPVYYRQNKELFKEAEALKNPSKPSEGESGQSGKD